MRAANTILRSTQYKWRFLTLTGASVESSSGLRVAADGALADGKGAILFVIPSYGFRELVDWDTLRKLQAARRRYTHLAGLDTGSWLLAAAGLLNHYRATIHWDELTRFAETFPLIDVQRERFCVDGDRITCSGAMAAFDLMVHLIGEAHGPFVALQVSQLFMARGVSGSGNAMPMGRQSVAQKATAVMMENLEVPVTIGTIAAQIGVSQKTLETRMKAEMQAPPKTVYRQLRLTLAYQLVTETEHSVSEIADRCGYENSSAMTRAFKQEFNTTPAVLRKMQ